MDTNFSQIVTGWHDFYITTATASATLVGLLFVAVSLHIDVLTDENTSNAQVVAREAFIHFIFVIAISMVFLVPDQTPAGLGVPLVLLSLIELASNLKIVREVWRSRKSPAQDRLYPRWQLFIAQLGYVIMLVIALTILNGQTNLLSWVFPVILLLMSGAAASAWNLLVRLAAIKRERSK